MEKPLFVSFSSGRTSAFMARYLQVRYPNREKVFLFANTGKEKEASLIFANECDRRWGLNLVWIEANVHQDKGKGTSYTVVDFETASRDNDFRKDPTTPFEQVIKKYGIPNRAFPHCTRELKIQPMHNYIKNALGWDDYETAIGYRADEKNRARYRPGEVYPLIDDVQVDKMFIREWWSRQPFDLGLKNYEGNCDLCWKKSKRKQLTLIKENPQITEWWDRMERENVKLCNGEPVHFFNKNQSTAELIQDSKRRFARVLDEYEVHKNARPAFDPSMDEELHCLCDAS